MQPSISSSPARSVPRPHPRRVVPGYKLPAERPLTENERAWIEMLRAIVGDRDPSPTRPAVQALRQVLME